MTWHLREFGWLWEHVKGTDGYPNVHLAQHIPEVLRDYGPAGALTCFPFERMNKNIGEININNRNIERSFSRTWWQLDQLAALPHLTGDWDRFSDDEKRFFRSLHASSTPAGIRPQVAP